jgi:asparagine synthase (glutamine-hydrolysing)
MPYDEAADDTTTNAIRAALPRTARTVGAKHRHRGRSVGAFLSGGTDSSTVAGVMARVAGHGPHTYSIGFDAEGFDEMEYARIASSHFGCKPHEYYVTSADVTAAIPKIGGAVRRAFRQRIGGADLPVCPHGARERTHDDAGR